MMAKFRCLTKAVPVTALCLLLSFGPSVAAPADDARKVVEGFHAVLLDAMKRAESLGLSGRFRLLDPEVGRRFDINLMSALTTGRYWRTAKPAERKRLAEAFRRFSSATYASRFSGFSGQSFRTLDVSNGPRNTQLVRTQIDRPDDKPVAITYVTRDAGPAWRIADILLDDGISEVAVRRSEYRTTLSEGGLPGLTRLLDRKTNEILSEGAAN